MEISNNKIKIYDTLGKISKKVLKSKPVTKKIFEKKDVLVFEKLAELNISTNVKYLDCDPSMENTIIWTGWLQGKDNMPKVANYCYKYINVNSNKHKIIFIDLDNLHQYLPEFPKKILDKYNSKKISGAHFMDLIRIKLINKYGGIWMDPTVLLTRPINDEIFFKDFSTYHGIPGPWHTNPADSKWCTFFLGGKKSNEFVKLVDNYLTAYWYKYDNAIDYFLLDYVMRYIYETNKISRKMVDKVPESSVNVFTLVNLLGKNYSKELLVELNEMEKMSPLFKLTYKDERINSENSLFSYVYDK